MALSEEWQNEARRLSDLDQAFEDDADNTTVRQPITHFEPWVTAAATAYCRDQMHADFEQLPPIVQFNLREILLPPVVAVLRKAGLA